MTKIKWLVTDPEECLAVLYGHAINVTHIGYDSRIQSCPNTALPVIGKTVVVCCSMKPDSTPTLMLLLSTFQCKYQLLGLKRSLTVAGAQELDCLLIDWEETTINS